jgi:NhaA family Na+:H+ antiporter
MTERHAAVHANAHPRVHAHVRHVRRQRMFARAGRLIVERFLLLPIGALIALVWANAAPESYFVFAQRLSFAVNEIGMAFVFALLAQEVVEALMPGGALHSWRRWTLPIVAAIGGIVGAVLTYLLYVYLSYEFLLAEGWPVACAIDAAATYYVLRTILPRSGALPFALALAIVSNIFGMLVVAPRHLVLETRVGGVALVTVALGLAALMRLLKVRAFWPYLLICGTISWVAFYWEGLHPAFSLIPIVAFLPHEPRTLNVFADPRDDDAVHHAEHEWNLIVQVVVFFFGLVNAGVILRAADTGSWAILTAMLIGRPLGILIAVGLAVESGLHLPRQMGWREVLVVALATSSGFLIALFFATGLLAPGPVLAQLKIGVLGSAAGALLAFGAARVLRVGKFAP